MGSEHLVHDRVGRSLVPIVDRQAQAIGGQVWQSLVYGMAVEEQNIAADARAGHPFAVRIGDVGT